MKRTFVFQAGGEVFTCFPDITCEHSSVLAAGLHHSPVVNAMLKVDFQTNKDSLKALQ